MGVSHPPVSRRSVGNTSKQPYFHLSACRRSSRAGIQSAIQGEWVFTRRIEDCAKPKAPGVSQAAHESDIFLADITTHNPNVWYELVSCVRSCFAVAGACDTAARAPFACRYGPIRYRVTLGLLRTDLQFGTLAKRPESRAPTGPRTTRAAPKTPVAGRHAASLPPRRRAFGGYPAVPRRVPPRGRTAPPVVLN